MREENVKTVESYLAAIGEKDLGRAPLAADIRFTDPIAGAGAGAENLRAFLSGFLPAVRSVRVIAHVCEGEFVVTHWEVEAVFGIIPILEKFRVRDGLITEAFGFFDPRPVLG